VNVRDYLNQAHIEMSLAKALDVSSALRIEISKRLQGVKVEKVKKPAKRANPGPINSIRS
jgi:hypothetical protein